MQTIGHLLWVGCIVGSLACGSEPGTEGPENTAPNGTAQDSSELGTSDAELGQVQEAIGEATCATGTVDGTISFTGSAATLPIPATYNNAACSQAKLEGYRSTLTKSFVDIFSQVTIRSNNQADCDAVKFTVLYFKRGALVTNFSGSTRRVSGKLCTVDADYVFNPTLTANKITGNTINLAQAAPVAADNARFAVQVLNGAGVKQAFEFDLGK